MSFNQKKMYWIETPSDNEEKGFYKEDVIRVEKDPDCKYTCWVRLDNGSRHRAKGSPEEVARKFWKSRALPDGNGGFYKKVTPRNN